MPIGRDTLVEYMVEHFQVREEDLADGKLLFSSGLLDSFFLVDLVVFIEKEAGIRVGATEVTLDNMDSIERILGFVDKRATA